MVKNEGLGFDYKRENSMKMKTNFMKLKDMENLAYSSKECVVVHEGGIPLPPSPSYGLYCRRLVMKRVQIHSLLLHLEGGARILV